MDFEYLRLSGIVESHYPLHNGDLIDRIQKSYEKYKYKLMFGMLTGGYDKYMEPINMIKNYYGEKYAYQIVFHIHYMAWLMIPSLLSLVTGAKACFEYY